MHNIQQYTQVNHGSVLIFTQMKCTFYSLIKQEEHDKMIEKGM